MADFRLDDSGDLYVSPTGELELVDGADAVRQNWRVVVKTFLGDWFRDKRVGIDYPKLFDKPGSLIAIRAQLVQASRLVAGVVEVSALSVGLDRPARQMQVLGTLRMDSGELVDLSYQEPILQEAA